jgi:hypothetical protein
MIGDSYVDIISLYIILWNKSTAAKSGQVLLRDNVPNHNHWAFRLQLSVRTANSEVQTGPKRVLYIHSLNPLPVHLKALGRAHRILVGSPERKRPLGIPRYRWKRNVEVDVKRNRIVWYGLDSSGSGWGSVEGSCENSNEPLGSIKCWEIHKVAEQLAASQGGLISIELASTWHCQHKFFHTFKS